MDDPFSLTLDLLDALLKDIERANVSIGKLDERLKPIFAAADSIESSILRGFTVSDFVRQLVGRITHDTLALRVGIMAHAAWRLLHHVDPATALQLGLTVASELSNRREEAASLHLIELIDDATRPDDPLWHYVRTMRIGSLVRLKRIAEARAFFEAEEIGRAMDARDGLGLQLLLLGARAAHATHDGTLARELAARAVERYDKGDAENWSEPTLRESFVEPDAAYVYCICGDIVRHSQDHLGAIEIFQRGRVRAFDEEDPRGAALCLSEVGITWEHLSDFERGGRLLEQAAFEAEKAGDLESATRWRKQPLARPDGIVDLKGVNGLAAIGRALQTEGQIYDLQPSIKAIIKASKGDGTTNEPIARNLLAIWYARQGLLERALVAVQAAINVAASRQNRWLELSFKSHRVSFLTRARHFSEALEACEQLLTDAERFLSDANTSEIRQAAMGAVAQASELGLLQHTVGLKYEDGSEAQPTSPEKVLQFAHRMRGRTFNRWMALLDWSRGQPDVAVRLAVRSLIESDVVLESSAHQGRSIETAMDRRGLAQAQLDAVASEAGLAMPLDQAAPDLAGLGERLQPRTAIMDMSPTLAGIACVFIPGAQPARTMHVLWERSERARWRDAWRSACARETEEATLGQTGLWSGIDSGDGKVPGGGGFASIAAAYEALDASLFRRLIEWIGPDIDHLVVAIHSELAFLPLWALTTRAPRLALSVMPTVRSIEQMSSRPAAAEGRWIAVGDATRTLAMSTRECELLDGFSTVVPTVEGLLAAVSDATRLHFAGHGEFDADDPYASGIVLQGVHAPPYTVATGQAGCVRLTIPGILRSIDAANCELVVLSACSVGSARSHAAGEFTSVPTAFLLAGARNVLAAGWQVHDAATTVLMVHFYQALNKVTPNSVPRALSLGRRALARTTRQEAIDILGRDDVIPPGEYPFGSPLFTDAVLHYGVA